MNGGLLDDLHLEELEKMNQELYDQIVRLQQRRADVQGEIESRQRDRHRVCALYDTLSFDDKRTLSQLLAQHGYCTVAKELA